MKTEGGGKYQVKLVPTHCHREETIVDIISALDHLNSITNEIFSSIKEKISSQQAQVTSLSARVAVTAAQVEQLKVSQKGVRILSSAKYASSYPEDETKGVLSVTFPTLNMKPLPPQGSTIGRETLEMLQSQNYLLTSSIKNPSELLQFYHVRDANAVNASIDRVENLYETGLGTPSENLNTTESFLLFNTAQNPYQNYRVTEKDSKKSLSNKMSRKVEAVEDLPKLGEEGKKDNPPEGDDFYYFPTSVDFCPDIDIPDQLPDLPGIADSINLAGQTMDLYPKPTLNQRPTTSTTTVSSTSNKQDVFSASLIPPSSSHNVTSASSSGMDNHGQSVSSIPIINIIPNSSPMNPASTSFVPPPPPPPPPMTNSALIPPPPPPPPPPPSVDLASSSSVSGPKEEKKKEPQTKAPPPSVDVRSSLMAAIREAGGTNKLRSAKDRKYEAKKKKQEEKEKQNTGGGEANDLMADLKNSLAMRRRGISGMNDGQRQAGLSDIMNKLAATIPSLEDSNEEVAGGSISDDDDWDS